MGFASFDLPGLNSTVDFYHDFIDMNKGALANGTSPEPLPTLAGRELTRTIHTTESSAGLLQRLGCNNISYESESPALPPGQKGSLWDVYLQQVIPHTLFSRFHTPNDANWFITSSGSLRYPLYQGNVTVNDIYSVLPFEDQVYVVRGTRGSALNQLLTQLNSQQYSIRVPLRMAVHDSLPDYLATDDSLAPEADYSCFFVEFDRPAVMQAIAGILGKEPTVTATGFNDTGLWFDWVASLPC